MLIIRGFDLLKVLFSASWSYYLAMVREVEASRMFKNIHTRQWYSIFLRMLVHPVHRYRHIRWQDFS